MDVFQNMVTGLKADLFNNGSAYAGWYPPVTLSGERVGERGEILFTVGSQTHRLRDARQVEKEGRHMFVRDRDLNDDFQEYWLQHGGMHRVLVLDDDDDGN
jgi:hypothetical protein